LDNELGALECDFLIIPCSPGPFRQRNTGRHQAKQYPNLVDTSDFGHDRHSIVWEQFVLVDAHEQHDPITLHFVGGANPTAPGHAELIQELCSG
jgi:hypothetical protein